MPSPCTDSVSLPHHVSFFFVGGMCEIAYVYVGLKYDDILIESDPDVALATKRLSDADRQARDRRLKRALDISFKKKPLPDEIQQTLTPFEPYMLNLLEEAKELRLERELLKGPR